MTTIAYIGSFGRSWNTEEHVARDAEALGCTVHRIEESELASGRDWRDYLPVGIEAADLVLYTKTHGLPPSATDVWAQLEKIGVRTASFHLDLYRGLQRGSEVLDDPFWRTGTVFTADGDPDTQAELELLGINHRWLPAACVSDECIEVDRPEVDFAESIVFVGSYRGYHPEWPWRMEMLAALRQRYGNDFAALPYRPDEPLRGLRLNALYQSPGRVVVGDSLALPSHCRYTSDRIFETLGRGGALLFPRVCGLADLGFREFAHLIYYDVGDFDGLFGAIDSMLGSPDECRAMARRGQQFVRGHHTYQHRVRTMLAEVGLEVPA